MILSDLDLRAAMFERDLLVAPLDDANIQPASIDLKLADSFRTLTPLTEADTVFGAYIDPLEPPQGMDLHVVLPGQQFPLPPKGFALGSTVEQVIISPNLVGILAGKSSLARHGLMVEAAGYCDPGFEGQLTLELYNQTDRTIMLTPGMLIAQLAVARLTSRCVRPYGSKNLRSRYQGQHGPTPARLAVKR